MCSDSLLMSGTKTMPTGSFRCLSKMGPYNLAVRASGPQDSVTDPTASQRLLFHWNADHNGSHDIIDLEVPFGAVLMGIVAADASLGDSKIRIDGLEVTYPSFLHKTGMGFGGMGENSPQACFFKLAGGGIPLVDGPEADQSILYADTFFRHGTARLH